MEPVILRSTGVRVVQDHPWNCILLLGSSFSDKGCKGFWALGSRAQSCDLSRAPQSKAKHYEIDSYLHMVLCSRKSKTVIRPSHNLLRNLIFRLRLNHWTLNPKSLDHTILFELGCLGDVRRLGTRETREA